MASFPFSSTPSNFSTAPTTSARATLDATLDATLATALPAPGAPSAANGGGADLSGLYTGLLSLFAIPRAALPSTDPAHERLITLALSGYDIRAYPRLGARDLECAENWNLWLHDQRITLADWRDHWAKMPVPAFPDGAPVLASVASDTVDDAPCNGTGTAPQAEGPGEEVAR